MSVPGGHWRHGVGTGRGSGNNAASHKGSYADELLKKGAASANMTRWLPPAAAHEDCKRKSHLPEVCTLDMFFFSVCVISPGSISEGSNVLALPVFLRT